MSEIRATTISDAAGTGPITLTGQSAAKLTLEYNQIVPSIGGSLHVSSVSDNAAGNFVINVTSAFADQASRMLATSGMQKGVDWMFTGGPNDSSTSILTMASLISNGTATDGTSGVAAFGDLA